VVGGESLIAEKPMSSQPSNQQSTIAMLSAPLVRAAPVWAAGLELQAEDFAEVESVAAVALAPRAADSLAALGAQEFAQKQTARARRFPTPERQPRRYFARRRG